MLSFIDAYITQDSRGRYERASVQAEILALKPR